MNTETDIYKQHIGLLGFKAKDKVTGFSGVIDCVSFDLYGCIQVAINPPADDSGKKENSQWFDVTRMDDIGKHRVMDAPNFSKGYIANGEKGAADKPMRQKLTA